MSSRAPRAKASPSSAGPTRRKRAASVSKEANSKSGEDIQSELLPPSGKRIKKMVSGSPEYASQPSVVITSKQRQNLETMTRRLSFGSIVSASDAVDDNLVAEETSNPSEKRPRRLTEKALYMSATPSMTSATVHDKKRTPVNKASQPLSPEIDFVTDRVKTEPVDSSSFLYSTPQNKGKKLTKTAIEISSDEKEIATPTPKGKLKSTSAKHDVASLSKIKPFVLRSYHEDQRELAGTENSSSKSSSGRAIASVTSDDETDQLDGSVHPSPPSLTEPLVIVPAKVDMRAEYCPSALLVDGCPMELGSGAFEFFDEDINRSLDSAISFKHLQPFSNISSLVAGDISVDNFRHDVLWKSSQKPVVFSMLASVHSCNLIHPLQLKNYKIKALTVVPYGESWHQFEVLLGGLYGAGDMQGPFEYGCLLKLTSRREGGYGGYSGTTSVPSTPVATTPKKNLKAFASSRTKSSTLWFDRKQPSCLNFTDDIPIYDASETPFLFKRDDFVSMQNLPRYRKYGVRSPSDLPYQSIVSVFFTLNTYPKDYGSSASASSQYGSGGADGGLSAAPTTPTYQNSVLSFNLHSVLYYGVIPDDSD